MRICMGCMNQIENDNGVCTYCGYNAAKDKQESYYLKPESIIGRKYIVGRVLNYNGYTVSYMGLDAEARRKVVIKEYLPNDFSTRADGEKDVTIFSGDAMEKFEQGLINLLNEANRIQQLNEIESIAKVYDCFSENDTGYIVSEYIEGITLKEILDAGKRFSPVEAGGLITNILRDLCLVHPLNIIHCDISPDTIMITKSGKIKLLDFGATRYVTTDNSKSLAIILKQGYAPEEQYRSKGIRGPWTDVYALGAVMYRMITGIVPQESVERMINDELKAPSQMGVAISDSLENALMNALNVYQTERTQSAEIFLSELNSVEVKRKHETRRKRDTGKLPFWAKGLAAGLFLLAVTGGGILCFLPEKEVQTIDSSRALLKNYVGETRKNIDADMNQINKNKNWKIEWDFEEVFDGTKPKGEVCRQDVKANTDLSAYKDGKETLHFSIYRNNAFYYKEIAGLNASELAHKLYHMPIKDRTEFKKDKESNKYYYEISRIETKQGKKIKADELQGGKNADKEIAVGDIKSIFYATSNFGYKENFPDYVKEARYKNKLNQSKFKIDICKIQEGKAKPQSTGKKSLLYKKGLIDYYYTFDGKKYTKGEIFKQNVPPGQIYDERDEQGNALLRVIKRVISYRGETGQEVKKKLENIFGRSADIEIASEYGTGKVKDVVAKPECFQKGQKVKIWIYTKKPSTHFISPGPMGGGGAVPADMKKRLETLY